MMMMQYEHHPTVEIPQWDPPNDDPTTPIFSPQTHDYFSALHRYLPSSEFDSSTCDTFRMYVFKVRNCPRGRSHDWTDCPYAHPGEKARRRDPRKFHYSATPCPDFRRGSCRKGESCEFAHGVFECWLHPARYRTQPCKDGPRCTRRVCFFAHSVEQLRRRGESLWAAVGPGFGLGLGLFGQWDGRAVEEDAPMERVESGRDLRARMYAKLSEENSVGFGPDFGWVS